MQLHGTLVIEVVDSTLKYDSEVKDKLYTQPGIMNDWVLDLKNHQLQVFWNLTPASYVQSSQFD
jgi:hypothetical protein